LPPQNRQIKAGDVQLHSDEDVEHGMEHEEPSVASSITVDREPADNDDPNHHRTSHAD
jgi:hypothetical protein